MVNHILLRFSHQHNNSDRKKKMVSMIFIGRHLINNLG